MKSHPAQGKGEGKRTKKKGFTGGESNKDWEKCTLRQSQSYLRRRYIRCSEQLVAEAGMSCLFSCHQWHRVEEAGYFLASHVEFMSCTVCTVARCLVGWKRTMQNTVSEAENNQK